MGVGVPTGIPKSNPFGPVDVPCHVWNGGTSAAAERKLAPATILKKKSKIFDIGNTFFISNKFTISRYF